jgi:phenylpropionate dioxygenase-like ring-hydroxylating dioxygenase large terminal subunit
MTETVDRRDTGEHFRLLPRDQYLNPAIFEREYDRVFSRQWLFVGHRSQLDAPGTYLVEEILGESVVVTVTDARELRAFLNVCRHRGHRICEQPSGRVKRFVCPYHRWTYSLNGELTGATAIQDGDGIDYAELSLFPVHVTEFEGFLYICLGDERPPELGDELRAVVPGIERFRLATMREAHRETYELRVNWKVLLENYLECHHCPGSHPELTAAMDLPAMFATTAGWVGEYFGGSMPLMPGKSTASLDGELLSRPLGIADPSDPADVAGSGFGIVPTLSRVIVHVDHAVVHTLRPVSVDEVIWHTRWYVDGAAIEGVDYDVDRLTSVWRATNQQDIGLCESAYRGVRSRRFVSGPLHGTREAAIRSALATYTDMMEDGHTS